MTVKEALRVDAHNDPPDVREQAIYVILTEAADKIRSGDVAQSQSYAFHANERLAAHIFMLQRVEGSWRVQQAEEAQSGEAQ